MCFVPCALPRPGASERVLTVTDLHSYLGLRGLFDIKRWRLAPAHPHESSYLVWDLREAEERWFAGEQKAGWKRQVEGGASSGSPRKRPRREEDEKDKGQARPGLPDRRDRSTG